MFLLQGAKYVEEPNVHFDNETANREAGIDNPAVTDTQTVATVKVTESTTDNIHSFENPQAVVPSPAAEIQAEQSSN